MKIPSDYLMPSRFQETSPAQMCKKNNWKKDTLLEARMSNSPLTYHWKITAVGVYHVLGIRISLQRIISSSEEVMPFNNSQFKWKRIQVEKK